MAETEKTLERINRLANEKLNIYLRASHGGLSEEDRLRLQSIERELADLWEQRRRELAGKRDIIELWIERSYSKAA